MVKHQSSYQRGSVYGIRPRWCCTKKNSHLFTGLYMVYIPPFDLALTLVLFLVSLHLIFLVFFGGVKGEIAVAVYYRRNVTVIFHEWNSTIRD